jgi:hypothetical protein
MPNLIDRYVLGARVAPVTIVSLSLFLAVSAWIPFSEWPTKLAGGGVFLVIGAFALGQLARDAGKAIEPRLWASWDGPPSVRMLRHRDPTFPAGSKSLMHRRLIELGVVDQIPSEAEEQQDPVHADEVYRTCSDWLRRKALELKSKAPFDVVHSENIYYGFRRNLLGIKRYGLALTGAACAVAVAAFFFDRKPIIDLVLMLFLGAYLLFGVTEAAVKSAADEYAKRLLDAIQALDVPRKSAPKQRGAKARST